MGPLIGGALTDTGRTGWRWCFYINLPYVYPLSLLPSPLTGRIGGITLILLLLTIPSVPLMPPFSGIKPTHSRLVQLLHLDWIGALLTLGFVTCLGVGLQWGGVSKEWQDAGVIVVSPVDTATLTVDARIGRSSLRVFDRMEYLDGRQSHDPHVAATTTTFRRGYLGIFLRVRHHRGVSVLPSSLL